MWPSTNCGGGLRLFQVSSQLLRPELGSAPPLLSSALVQNPSVICTGRLPIPRSLHLIFKVGHSLIASIWSILRGESLWCSPVPVTLSRDRQTIDWIID